MTSIKDVAEQAGVSMSTVSHVINQTRYVSPELTERVEKAIDNLNYRPSALARGLRRKETLTLGLLIPDNSNPFFSEVAKGAEDAGFEYGYSVILCNANGMLEKELSYLNTLISKQVDGIIIISGNLSRKHIGPLLEDGCEIIVVDREIDDLSVDTIKSDDFQGAYDATRYLLELGHRRIACVTGLTGVSNTRSRLEGYKVALSEAGIVLPESYIAPGNFYATSGYECVQSLMALPETPTAIFFHNDLMALGAIRALYDMGIHVPSDVSIIGYDDISLLSYTIPALTTVAQPKYAIGRLAVEMLIERLSSTEKQEYRQLILETQLIKRETTVPVKR